MTDAIATTSITTEPVPRFIGANGSSIQLDLGFTRYLQGTAANIGTLVSGTNKGIADLKTSFDELSSATDANTATIAINYTTLTNADSALATRTLTLETDVYDATTGLATKASITYVDTVESTLEGSIATSASTITAAYTAADSALQTDINTRATISYVDSVETTLEGSIASSASTLTAAYEAADSTLQTDINTRATSTELSTVESTLEGAIASSASTLTAAYEAGDASLLSDINDVADDVSDLTTVVSSKASVSELAAAEATAAAATAALETSVDASLGAINVAGHNFAPNPTMNDKIQQYTALPDGWDNIAYSGGSGWAYAIGKGKDTSPDIFSEWFPKDVYGIAIYKSGSNDNTYADLRSDWFYAPVFEKELFLSIYSGSHRNSNILYCELERFDGGSVNWSAGVDFSNQINKEQGSSEANYGYAGGKRQWIKTPILSGSLTTTYTGRIRYLLRTQADTTVSNPTSLFAFWHSPKCESKQLDEQTTPSPYTPATDTVTSASVRTLVQAFVKADGTAYAGIRQVAEASGSTPARFELTSADGTSSVLFDADTIYFGEDTYFETTYNTFVTDSGSSWRKRYGAPFPASGDLVEWFGPSSVALNSETRTNGYWAVGTDGKIYYGNAELNTGSAGFSASFSGTFVRYAASAQTVNWSDIVTTPANGSGSYSYSWSHVSGTNLNITSTTSANPDFSYPVNGTDVTGTYELKVIDNTSGDVILKRLTLAAIWTA